MHKKYSNYFVISDLDGTLLNKNKSISDFDIKAIEAFVENGGKFAIATGRVYASALPYIKQLKVNMPCILFNGGIIFDTFKEQVLWSAFLPESARKITAEILSEFPQAGAEILTEKEVYVPRFNKILEEKMLFEKVKYIEENLEDIPGNWLKVLFTLEDHLIPEMVKFVRSKAYKEVSFVESFGFYYEMLSQNISKGFALRKLLDILPHAKNFKVIAVGDYNNDIEMLKAADIGACVADSPDEVKKAADLVLTKTSEESALAELINYIKNLEV